MVKFYENSFSYKYPFSAVSLAYFLRFPNPYATHVLSTDVIDRHFDPVTQRLTTTRLLLKKPKIPQAMLKLLPKGIVGASSDGGQSYTLEKSVVDLKEGWMETEARNLEWTGLLSVVEKQVYRRRVSAQDREHEGALDSGNNTKHEGTDVTTVTKLVSRYGQGRILANRRKGDRSVAHVDSSVTAEDDSPGKKGFFSAWSTSSLQRSIEIAGLQLTRKGLAKSKDGMNVVLERLRLGGLKGVLEGTRKDRESMLSPNNLWNQS